MVFILTLCCESQYQSGATPQNFRLHGIRHTLSSTLPKALSSSSTLVFSTIRSISDILSLPTPFATLCAVVGPEGTVGVCMSSISNPMLLITTKSSLEKVKVKVAGAAERSRLARFSRPLTTSPRSSSNQVTVNPYTIPHFHLQSSCSANPSFKPSNQVSAALSTQQAEPLPPPPAEWPKETLGQPSLGGLLKGKFSAPEASLGIEFRVH